MTQNSCQTWCRFCYGSDMYGLKQQDEASDTKLHIQHIQDEILQSSQTVSTFFLLGIVFINICSPTLCFDVVKVKSTYKRLAL